MNTLAIKPNPLILDASFDADSMHVFLADGRSVSIPLEWFPRLRDAKLDDLNNWRLIGNGIGLHWELLDEDVSVETLLRME